MPENKIFKEFLESTYDREKNYNSICSKIKGGIDMKKKILNIAAVLLIVLVTGVTAQSVYAKIAWHIEYKEYENRNVIRRTLAIDENNYSENLNMDYMYQDNIGIKIKSFMITNDYLQLDFDIKFDKEMKIDKDDISYGIAIYDENNNIYIVNDRMHHNKNKSSYRKKLYKELGVKSANMLTSSSFYGLSGIRMTSDKGFPQSKKLYIRIFDIGYTTYKYDDKHEKIIGYEENCLSDSEWQFEIDVPEKFYKRTTVELVPSKEVEGIVINKAELTETALIMKVNINGFRDFLMSGRDMETEEFNKSSDAAFYISDGDGNIYTASSRGTTQNENEISARFGIGKDALDKKIFVNVSLNDIQTRIELVQK